MDLYKLIEKAQKGDRDAFGQIYNLFFQRIYRYCQFNVGRTDLAEDLCQETFLHAWKSHASFSQRKGGSFQAYLFKIARNLIIDYKRKKREVPLAEYIEIEATYDLDEEIDRQKENEILKKALNKLKEVERQIVILRYFEEMTTTEVAKVVGMREGALRVRTHRILKKLRVLIEKHD